MKRFLIPVLVLVCQLVASAQMGSHLREEFHDQEKYGTVIVDGVKGLRSALHDPDVRVICFQSFNETLPEETHKQLLEWVREGHTLWFYDARLAPGFGMKPYFLQEEQFKHKPEDGVLGGSKVGGYATTTVSFGSHAVQTGVGQVTVFLPRIESAETPSYGAVQPEGDTVALLQFTLDSPALVALRREGRGLIVFKSLLWTEPLSGDRFQSNLLEYSAGFQVPGPAGQGRVGSPPGPEAEYVVGEPATPLEPGRPPETTAAGGQNAEPRNTITPRNAPDSKMEWELELKDGTRLLGVYEADEVRFETGTGSLRLKPDDIETLVFGSSISLDKVTTLAGKTSTGLLISTPVKFRTEQGLEEFEKENLSQLRRQAPPDNKETE